MLTIKYFMSTGNCFYLRTKAAQLPPTSWGLPLLWKRSVRPPEFLVLEDVPSTLQTLHCQARCLDLFRPQHSFQSAFPTAFFDKYTSAAPDLSANPWGVKRRISSGFVAAMSSATRLHPLYSSCVSPAQFSRAVCFAFPSKLGSPTGDLRQKTIAPWGRIAAPTKTITFCLVSRWRIISLAFWEVKLRWFENSFPFSITTELYERFYLFVVKDYYYLLIADVAITFKLINSCTLTDTLVVMATWQALKYTLFLVFSCIFTQKVVGKLPFLLHQKLFTHQRTFFKKV